MPAHVREALDSGAAGADIPGVRIGPRRSAHLNRLDHVFFDTRSIEDIDALVAAYARCAGLRAMRSGGG